MRLLALTTVLALAFSSHSAFAREWTLKKGSKFEADFVELKDVFTAVLKNKAGKKADYTLDKFDIEDVWWIRRHLNTNRTTIVPYGWCAIRSSCHKHKGKSIAIGVHRDQIIEKGRYTYNILEHKSVKYPILPLQKEGHAVILPSLTKGNMQPSFPKCLEMISALEHAAKPFRKNIHDVSQYDTRNITRQKYN